MIETLYITEVKKMLKAKDNRTAEKWLSGHDVGILKEEVSKKKFVVKAEFEMAKDEQPLRYLRDKYGDNFPEALSAYLNMYSQFRIAVEEKEKKQNNAVKNDGGYVPQGKKEKEFLKKLTHE